MRHSEQGVKINGAKLTEARIAAGRSQDEVAAFLKCNKSSVSRWERGVLTPSKKRVLRLVKWLGSSEFVVSKEILEAV